MDRRHDLKLRLAASLERRPGLLIMAGFAIIFVVGLVVIPHLGRWLEASGRTNYGFGPGWTCTFPGEGEKVCLKNAPSGGAPAQVSGQP